jgi:hypothetical protein
VATTGSSSRRLAAGAAAALSLALCLGQAACTAHPARSHAASAPASGRTGAARPGSGGSPAPTGPASAAPAAFCAARPSGALRRALARTVPGSTSGEIVPLGVSSDGRTAYVSAWMPGFSGVAELDLATGQLRRIQAFARPATDQADGVSDGQWLVWAETYSLTNLDRFTIYAANAVTGRVLRLGQSIPGPNGVPWPSPWHAPAVGGGYAAWAQGYGPGGLVEIRLANLATGQVRTIRTGHTQPPFFDGNLVVWPESDAPGTQTTLRAYSLSTGRLTQLPVALRAVHGTDSVVTDGTRTAYLSPDMTRLYYSPAQDQPARPALRLPLGLQFSGLAMAPGLLAWTTSAATYLASTRTGAFVRVTPRFGYATGSGSVVLVTDAPGQKQAHPALPLHVIDPGSLNWPACQPGSRPR